MDDASYCFCLFVVRIQSIIAVRGKCTCTFYFTLFSFCICCLSVSDVPKFSTIKYYLEVPEIARPPPEEVPVFVPEEEEEETVPEIPAKGTPFLLVRFIKRSSSLLIVLR